MFPIPHDLPDSLRERARSFLETPAGEIHRFAPEELQNHLVRPLLEARNELGTRLVHRLRSPLTVIRNNLYDLDSACQTPTTGERESALTEMRRAVARFESILHEIESGW